MPNFKLKIASNKQSGLTLIESLVAITVLLVGVLGPLSIAAQGIGDGIFARNQLAANYLAQEALEIVVNRRYELVRQYQYLPAPEGGVSIFSTDSELNNCLTAGPDDYCAVDAAGGTISICGEDNEYLDCQLVFDAVSGLYQPAAGVSAPNRRSPIFTRKLRLELVGLDQLKATVTVEWLNKDIPRSLTIVTHLFSKG